MRGPAQEGVTRTDTSAAAIGTVLGGVAAQHLGSLWVYVLMAVAALLLSVFVRYIFPAHLRPIDQQRPRSARQALAFVRSRSILPIIAFIMLPVVLAGGYDSFMFPLLSSDLGLSTSVIHDISAFGKLIVYVMIGTIGRMGERLGKWTVAPASVALIGLTFLVFSFNTTLEWSILVIALVAVLSKSSDGWKALWLRAAEARDFPRSHTVGMMFATRAILLVVQPLILTALLNEAGRFAITVLGVLCVLCAGLFWYTTRNSELIQRE